MEAQKTIKRNKGGRPKKAIKKDQILALKCTLFERRSIEARAKSTGLTVSEYLREIALTGKIDMRKKSLPKEVLLLTGRINHTAANLNQIAKKRNSGEDLNPIDRANLRVQSDDLKEVAIIIKTFLQ
jgi:hypothetical protein